MFDPACLCGHDLAAHAVPVRRDGRRRCLVPPCRCEDWGSDASYRARQAWAARRTAKRAKR